MVMRLVRDDTFNDELVVGSTALQDEETVPSDEADGSTADAEPRRASGRRRNKSKREEQQVEQPEQASAESEPADGAVVEVSDDDNTADETESDAPEKSNAPAIDLRSLEALLLTTHSPLTAGQLGDLLDLSTTKPVRKAIAALNEQYEQRGRAFRVEQVAGGYQILTLPEFGELLKAFHRKEADAKLTKAALETLSIIAYKQPILRADVESIRGVACGETIRSLMEKHLVNIAGRAEEPGRPILYGTTKRFLELFGLNNLKDLPQPEQQGLPKRD